MCLCSDFTFALYRNVTNDMYFNRNSFTFSFYVVLHQYRFDEMDEN